MNRPPVDHAEVVYEPQGQILTVLFGGHHGAVTVVAVDADASVEVAGSGAHAVVVGLRLLLGADQSRRLRSGDLLTTLPDTVRFAALELLGTPTVPGRRTLAATPAGGNDVERSRRADPTAVVGALAALARHPLGRVLTEALEDLADALAVADGLASPGLAQRARAAALDDPLVPDLHRRALASALHDCRTPQGFADAARRLSQVTHRLHQAALPLECPSLG